MKTCIDSTPIDDRLIPGEAGPARCDWGHPHEGAAQVAECGTQPGIAGLAALSRKG